MTPLSGPTSSISKFFLRVRLTKQRKDAGRTVRERTSVRDRAARTEDAEVRRVRRTLSAAAVCLVLAAVVAQPAAADPFGIESFSVRTTDAADADYTVAGGHPDKNVTEFEFTSFFSQEQRPFEQMRDSYVTLAPGFIGNPTAAPRCPLANVTVGENNVDTSTCPPGSQVGLASISLSGNIPIPAPIYNVVPETGYPAQFAFNLVGTRAKQVLSVLPLPRTSSYGLRV